MSLLEISNRDTLEDMYYFSFSEYPLEDLSVEDLQYNISKYLLDASKEEINKVFKGMFL